MTNALTTTWDPPGPVSAAFMALRGGTVEGLNGPVGSGKTTTVLVKLLRLAAEQRLNTKLLARNSAGQTVPVRSFKACIVRDTYRNLWRTTLASWWRQVPKEAGVWTGAENAPGSHRINFELKDGTIVDFVADFIAIGENAVEDVMRGYEPTVFYLNEMDLLTAEVLAYARTRLGRFPPADQGGATWSGILFDCNAPEFESWLHKDLFLKSPEQLAADDVKLLIQPSGLSPRAENLKNLPGGAAYYVRMARGQKDWFVKRMIENKAGFSRSGKPVYTDWEDDRHVAPADMAFLPGLPLIVGIDGGGSPAGIFMQRTTLGQWRILDELITEHGTGPTRFGQLLRQRLHDRFPRARTIVGYSDPSADYGADRDNGEKNWREIVEAQAGIVIRAAPTNDPGARWDAVRAPLTRSIEGGPAFQLSPRCATLRIGFNSGYRFRRRNVADTRFDERAEKNEFSHPHDALQYGISGGGEDHAIRERVGARRALLNKPGQLVHDWDPLQGGA